MNVLAPFAACSIKYIALNQISYLHNHFSLMIEKLSVSNFLFLSMPGLFDLGVTATIL